MMDLTPGTPDGPCCCRPVRVRRPRTGGWSWCRPSLTTPARPLGGKRDHRRGDARQRFHGLFDLLAHRFPSLHRARIDANRKEHLAVADHDVRYGAGVGDLAAVGGRNRRKAFENLFFGQRHARNLPARLVEFVTLDRAG